MGQHGTENSIGVYRPSLPLLKGAPGSSCRRKHSPCIHCSARKAQPLRHSPSRYENSCFRRVRRPTRLHRPEERRRFRRRGQAREVGSAVRVRLGALRRHVPRRNRADEGVHVRETEDPRRRHSSNRPRGRPEEAPKVTLRVVPGCYGGLII